MVKIRRVRLQDRSVLHKARNGLTFGNMIEHLAVRTPLVFVATAKCNLRQRIRRSYEVYLDSLTDLRSFLVSSLISACGHNCQAPVPANALKRVTEMMVLPKAQHTGRVTFEQPKGHVERVQQPG